MIIKYESVFLFFILFISSSLGQKFGVAGSVVDKETGKPLSYANVRIDGTTNGTSSNYDGFFNIKLPAGNYKLVFSYIGYKSESISVNVPVSSAIKIFLQPEPVKLSEVVINANEDPAYRIIREAIKRKRENRKGLNNFEYDAYSRRIIKSAGEVAVIEESFVKGYNKLNQWEKEYVLSTHRTENQKKQLFPFNLAIAGGYNIDFSRDTLAILFNKVFLPIADNAFDYYDYKLLDVKESAEGEIYRIKVIPLSNIQPLLQGEITIESKTYAINSVDLEINKGVRIPYINNLSVKFVEQLGKYNGYWLPNYIETSSGFEVNFQGLIGLERMQLDELNSINNYKINGVIPDSVSKGMTSTWAGLMPDTSGKVVKPIELSREEINRMRPIPLTIAETEAYANLDSSKTLEKMIKVKGPLSGLAESARTADEKSNSWFSSGLKFIDKYFTFGNNRVNGILVGPKFNDYIVQNKLFMKLTGGYTFQRKKLQGDLQLNYKFKSSLINEVNAQIFYEPKPWQKTTPYPDFANGIAVTLGFDDQFNYYLSKGYRLGISKNFSNSLSTQLYFSSEEERSMDVLNYQGIFRTKRIPRINPGIEEGTDNRIRVIIQLGPDPTEIQAIPQDGLTAQIDFSNPALASDFNYKKIEVTGLLTTKTFYKELFIAPYLELIVNAGIVSGNYGPQHLLSPGTSLGFFAPPGMLKGLNPYQYAGTEMITFQAEHNWRSIPFQALGLDFISDLFWDFMTGVSISKTWNDSNYLPRSSMNKPYWEIYTGISRILGAFRVDVSYNAFRNFQVTAAFGVIL